MDDPCYVPVSVGELVDKYTILLIKIEHVQDPNHRAMLDKELSYLRPLVDKWLAYIDPENMVELSVVNQRLWDVEDQLRRKERLQEFDGAFIQLARSVYLLNDRRAEIKRQVNAQSKSCLTEVKSYEWFPK